MAKKYFGIVFIFLSVIVNVTLCTLYLPPNTTELGKAFPARQILGEILGSSAIILFAWSLLLTTRLRFLERILGGLDQMYGIHKTAGMAGFLAIFCHFLSVPLDVSHFQVGHMLGIIAITGIFFIVLITIAPRAPIIGKLTFFSYHRWKKMHRLIGLFFIIGFIHAMNVDPLLKHSKIPFIYVQVFFFIGVFSYLYTEILSRFFRRKTNCTVTAIKHLNGNTIEISLTTDNKKLLTFISGQFVFIHFKTEHKLLSEPHPFTISSSPTDVAIRLSIKVSGDFTRFLFRNLKPDMIAIIEGPYGNFNYKKGTSRQIWVAAGIGITPFMSWIREFSARKLDYDIDFYYTVRSESEALFCNELEAASMNLSAFRVHRTYSAQGGCFTIDTIIKTSKDGLEDKSIFICGPLKMAHELRKNLIKIGVSSNKIYFEEFNLR